MNMYNVLMGATAGAIMLNTASAIKQEGGGLPALRGHGIVYLICGIPLAVLSCLMIVTRPLTANPPINTMFGDPSLLLAMLALAAGMVIIWGRASDQWINRQPALWVVALLGAILVANASAIFSYNIVGDAPSAEPITGQFKGWENATFGWVYLVGGVGCMFAPLYEKFFWSKQVLRWSLILVGVFWVAFSILNYRTHAGMEINMERGTNYKW